MQWFCEAHTIPPPSLWVLQSSWVGCFLSDILMVFFFWLSLKGEDLWVWYQEDSFPTPPVRCFFGYSEAFTKVINLHDLSCFKLRVRWRSWKSGCFMFQEMLCHWFVSVDKKTHTAVFFVFFHQVYNLVRYNHVEGMVFGGWRISPNSRNITEKGSAIRLFKDVFQLGNPFRLRLFWWTCGSKYMALVLTVFEVSDVADRLKH